MKFADTALLELNMRTRFGFNCIWLSLAMCCFSGCMTGWMVPNDPESERYADSVVAEVLVPGTPLTYSKEATSELLRNFPAKRFAPASVRVQVTVGQPIGPSHTSGLTQVVVGSSDGITKIAQYTTVT